MKPNDALSLSVLCYLTQTAIEDSLNLLEFEPLKRGYLFEIRVTKGWHDLESNMIAIWLIKLFDNVAVNVVYDESFERDEWMITDIQSGRCVHSYGA